MKAPTHAAARLALVGFLAGVALIYGTMVEAQFRPPARSTGSTLSGSYLAARTAFLQRDTEAAAKFYGNALRLDPTNPDLIASAFRLRLTNGEVEEAVPLASRLLGEVKTDYLAKLTLAVRSIRRNDYAGAEGHLAMVELGPLEQLTTGLLQAWAIYGKGDVNGALAALDKLSGASWYELFKNYHKALIADAAGRKTQALEWIKKSFDADTSGLSVVSAYSRILARNGNMPGAQKVLLDFSEQAQDHPVLARLLKDLAIGRPPGAVVATAQEGAAEALHSVAMALSPDARQQAAIYFQQLAYLQLAVFLDPKADLARIAVAGIFQDSDNPERAIATLKTVRPDSPLKPLAAVSTALNLEALKRTDEATAMLRKLLDENPGDMNAAMALGDVHRLHEDFAKAEVAYSEAIAAIGTVRKNHWRLFYYRGITYERTKRWAEAEADFKKALSLLPDQPQVLNYLGYSWVDMGINLDEALPMISKAVSLRPEDGYIVDSLGWAYYRLGRYEDAVKELERAVQLRPADPTINDHLGDAYWKVGRKLEAMFQWAHARDLKPEPDDLAKIVRKLESGLPANGNDKG